MSLSGPELRDLYRRTQIIRKPTYGIVSGYHELPYICLGGRDDISGATEVRGKIHVSPRFVLRPKHLEPSYAEIFGDDNVDIEIAGRVFGFLGFPDNAIECRSEHLTVTQHDDPVEDVLGRCLDELERYENITTGVIVAPDSRYYPVSVERFIASILEDEFKVK